MHVLMVTPHLPPEQGANAILPATLACELGRSGADVTLVGHPSSAGTRPGPGEPLAVDGEAGFGDRARSERLEEHGVFVVPVPRRGRGRLARTRGGAAAAALRMAIRLWKLVGRADVVHLHSNGLVVEVAGLLAERRRVPWVITLYGTDVWHYDSARHRRFARVVRGASHRIFYSAGLRDFARGLDLANEPTSVIYAPVASHFEPASAEERRAARTVLGLGEGRLLVTVKRLHPVAGHDDLLHAMPHVVGRFPEAYLVLIGDGPLRSSLEQLAGALGLARHVRFLGAVPHERVARYLAAADLFVLPSRLESWGTVMLEALACGTPVVATPTVGALEVRRYFPHDVRVAEGRDGAALAAAIVAALEVPRRVSDEARRQLRERFSPEACAAGYREVYGAAVGREGPGGRGPSVLSRDRPEPRQSAPKTQKRRGVLRLRGGVAARPGTEPARSLFSRDFCEQV